MSTNCRFYDKQAQPMMAGDLEVGQKLVRIQTPRSSWGGMTGSFRTTDYTVKKILKTRLVLEHVESGREIRLLVETSKWSVRQGEVTTAIEGTSQNWSRDPFILATEGEPLIDTLRAEYAEKLQQEENKRNARAAIDKVKANLGHDLESVENAIQALQALADDLRSQR